MSCWTRVCTQSGALLLLVLMLCLSLRVEAQATTPQAPLPQARWAALADTAFVHLTTDHGLPQGTVTALAEDRDGFLWVGTQGGLARWDGYRFHVYQPNPYDPHSLPDAYISTLHVDTRGQLWVGTNGGGLARYLPQTDQFQTIQAGASGLSHVGVTVLSGDGRGGLWVGTEAGLDHINARQKVVPAPIWTRNLPDMRIRGVAVARDGAIWVGTRNGVARVDARQKVELMRFPGKLGTNVLVTSLYLGSDGKIWVGIKEQGLFWFDEKLQAHEVKLNNGEIDRIDNMAEAAPGILWVGTNTQGIVAVDVASGQVRAIRNDVRLPSSLSDNSVWVQLRDHAGLMWVGTGRGLSRHAPLQQGVLTLFGINGRSDGIPDFDVQGILPVEDDKIWLVLGNRSLAVLDTASAKVSPLPSRLAKVFAITPDARGRVLAGTDNGLVRFDANGENPHPLILPPLKGGSSPLKASINETLFRDATTLLAERNIIWLGGVNGLWRLELSEQGEIVNWQAEVPGQLTDQRIAVMQFGAPGQILVGTDNGLNIVDTRKHSVERILPNRADPEAMSFGSIASVLYDKKQRLWVASAGGGISLLEKRDANGRARFRRMTQEHGLPHNTVNKLLEDAAGDIWASTDEGLAKINGRTLAIQALRRSEGVAISSYWADVGAITRHNELLFGGSGGLTVVNPALLDVSQYRPPVRITDMRIGGKSIPISPVNQAGPEGILIPAKTNNFSFELAALDYSAPERNRYAYRLNGYDKDWIETDASHRLVSYVNLAPGDYFLQIRGSNRNGVFSPDTPPLRLQVLPAWHQTWWMRSIEAALALGLILLVVQGRTYFLRQRQLELTEQVRSRTAELNVKQDQLISANAELAQTADTLRLMGDVGRDITANLEQDAVFEALYQHLGGLLDMSGMTIYQLDEDQGALVCCFAREDDQVLPQPTIAL
ncbi:MAG: hypothetical protein RL748_3300, partial [Pseudomonadota bacterium]